MFERGPISEFAIAIFEPYGWSPIADAAAVEALGAEVKAAVATDELLTTSSTVADDLGP